MENNCIVCNGDEKKIGELSNEEIDKLIKNESIGPVCEKCSEILSRGSILEKIDTESTCICIEPDGDILFTTISNFRKFMEHGDIGCDALIFYLTIMYFKKLGVPDNLNEDYFINELGWTESRTYIAYHNLLLIQREAKQ